MRFLRFLLVALLCVLGSVIIAWTVGALYFDLPAPPMLRMAAAIVWALGAAAPNNSVRLIDPRQFFVPIVRNPSDRTTNVALVP
jgi:hypothetical protein